MEAAPATCRQMLAFYIPLMFQALSQSLTYPLVAMVVVRGPLGSDALSAFAQGQTVMFILGTLGVGLVTTGMIHARDREGFRNFHRLNVYVAAAIAALQLLAALPPFDHLIFGRLLNLSGDLFAAARETLLLCLPAHAFFLLRNPYQVALYNVRASGRANLASMGRVAATFLFSYLWCLAFPDYGGIRPAVLVYSVPIVLEVVISRVFALRHIRALPRQAGAAGVWQQFRFNLPLTLGGFLMALSTFVIAAFIGHAADPTRMTTIHFVVMGIVNPLAISGLRVQAVTLSFLTSHGAGAQKVALRFAAMVGVALGAGVLVLQIPPASAWYFGTVQKLSPDDVVLAMTAALCLAPLPLLQSLRSHAEGIAAWQKRPNVILCGQVAYLATLVAVLGALQAAEVPGYLMGVVALSAAVLATQMTVRAGLAIGR